MKPEDIITAEGTTFTADGKVLIDVSHDVRRQIDKLKLHGGESDEQCLNRLMDVSRKSNYMAGTPENALAEELAVTLHANAFPEGALRDAAIEISKMPDLPADVAGLIAELRSDVDDGCPDCEIKRKAADALERLTAPLGPEVEEIEARGYGEYCPCLEHTHSGAQAEKDRDFLIDRLRAEVAGRRIDEELFKASAELRAALRASQIPTGERFEKAFEARAALIKDEG